MADFEGIYQKYFRDIYHYVLSLSQNGAVAEEVTQETFFKALSSIDRFDGRCSVYVWLCEIAKNTYFSHCRRVRRFADPPDMEEITDSLEEKLSEKETAFRVHQILHRLEEPYKEVFSLRIFGELSFKQIAELFGKTESWARVTYHRAKIKIREEL